MAEIERHRGASSSRLIRIIAGPASMSSASFGPREKSRDGPPRHALGELRTDKRRFET
jgi:hypothetical protein